ncbi:hypothetical protein LCGC14_1455070 [marine sediment metagenome]|uniref:Uncharacterized protein n=1 Tax=marine sediment metagenome TaxID=412755 RepID=A0A0F9JGN8_9ZZZZ
MCKRGDTKLITVHHTGSIRHGNVFVDKCLVNIICALNTADVPIPTESSCCGHGEKAGYIKLSDGQILGIYPNKESFLENNP